MQRYVVIERQDGVILYLIVRKESVRHLQFFFAQQKEVFSFWRRRPAAVNWWRVLASPKNDDLATKILLKDGQLVKAETYQESVFQRFLMSLIIGAAEEGTVCTV